jgi:hypothetical protein
MSDATYIACPRCGEPYAMTAMQKRLFHGRTLTCQRCAKPFTVTEQTPDPVPAPAVHPWAEMPSGSPHVEAGAAAAGAVAPGATGVGSDAAAAAGEVAPPRATAPRPTARGMTPGRMALLIFGVLGVLGLVAYLALLPSINRAREASRRASCVGNLQMIATATQMYAAGAGGRFPDSLDAVVLDGTLPVAALVCPSSHDTVAPGTTYPEQVAHLATGRHQSYVYVGRGLTNTSPRQPLAYEPLHHHGGKGVHVLYTDGTVQFLPAAVAATALPQLRGPTTAPAAPAPQAPRMVQ